MSPNDNRMRYLILFLLLCLTSMPTLASDTKIEAAIEAAWKEMDEGFANFDAEAAVKYLSPDFVLTHVKHPGLRVTRSQMLSVMKEKLPKIRAAGGKMRSTTSVLSLKKLDATTVEVETESRGTDQESSTARPVNKLERHTETWILVGGQWWCRSGHITSSKKS